MSDETKVCDVKRVKVNINQLKIRTEPIIGKIIGLAQLNQELEVLGEKTKFYKVKFNNSIGWAFKDYVIEIKNTIIIKPNLPYSNDLQYAHPLIKKQFLLAQNEIEKKCGVYVRATQCWRSKEYQAELYAQGRTKLGNVVTWVKISPHTSFPSCAVDFAVFSKDGKQVYWDLNVDLNKNKHPDWYEAINVFKKYGFASGSDWKNKKDVPHLEILFGKTYTQLNNMTTDQILILNN